MTNNVRTTHRNTLKVRAAVDGLRVPRELHPRQYITGAVAIVPATAYYIRRIAAGELVEVEDAAAPRTDAANDAGPADTDSQGAARRASKTSKGN